MSSNVVLFPGVRQTVESAADEDFFGPHRVARPSQVLDNAEEAVENDEVLGIVIVTFADDGSMEISSTYDQAFTEYVLQTALTRLQT